jgi:hypothetical protein
VQPPQQLRAPPLSPLANAPSHFARDAPPAAAAAAAGDDDAKDFATPLPLSGRTCLGRRSRLASAPLPCLARPDSPLPSPPSPRSKRARVAGGLGAARPLSPAPWAACAPPRRRRRDSLWASLLASGGGGGGGEEEEEDEVEEDEEDEEEKRARTAQHARAHARAALSRRRRALRERPPPPPPVPPPPLLRPLSLLRPRSRAAEEEDGGEEEEGKVAPALWRGADEAAYAPPRLPSPPPPPQLLPLPPPPFPPPLYPYSQQPRGFFASLRVLPRPVDAPPQQPPPPASVFDAWPWHSAHWRETDLFAFAPAPSAAPPPLPLPPPPPPAGLSRAEIARLPTNVVAAGARGAARECVVCLEEVAAGSEVRRLPCMHAFHVACIDEWLVRQPVCPVDRINVRDPAPAPP